MCNCTYNTFRISHLNIKLKFREIINLWIAIIYGLSRFIDCQDLWIANIYVCHNLWTAKTHGVFSIYKLSQFTLSCLNLWIFKIYEFSKFMDLQNLWFFKIYATAMSKRLYKKLNVGETIYIRIFHFFVRPLKVWSRKTTIRPKF